MFYDLHVNRFVDALVESTCSPHFFGGETLSKKQIRGVSPSLFLLPFQPPYDSSCLPASKHSWLFAEIVCSGCGWQIGLGSGMKLFRHASSFLSSFLFLLLTLWFVLSFFPEQRDFLRGRKGWKKRTLSAAAAAVSRQCAEFAPGLANHFIH